MKLGEFELEKMFEIWGPDGVLEVGPDRDGLDLIELRLKEREAKTSPYAIVARITMRPEQAHLLSQALLQLTSNKHG
jgi:hypothetical protein